MKFTKYWGKKKMTTAQSGWLILRLLIREGVYWAPNSITFPQPKTILNNVQAPSMGSLPLDSHVGSSSHHEKEITQSDLQTAQHPSTQFYFSFRKFNSYVSCQEVLTDINKSQWGLQTLSAQANSAHFLLSTQLTSTHLPTHPPRGVPLEFEL